MVLHHVVVDGSNIATEGRDAPSLSQLDAAVQAFMREYQPQIVTVVVDATFPNRIDRSERRTYEDAIAAGELITPPAGAVGRGDAFVLEIADRVGATVLSNDSFQEFHGTHDWLFDDGRLIGGKPVPHVGWVFMARTPVRGPASRRAISAAKRAQLATRRSGDGEEDIVARTLAGDGGGAAGDAAGASADAPRAKATKAPKAPKAAKATKRAKRAKVARGEDEAGSAPEPEAGRGEGSRGRGGRAAQDESGRADATAGAKGAKAAGGEGDQGRGSRGTKATKATKGVKGAKGEDGRAEATGAAEREGGAAKATRAGKAAKATKATKATKGGRGARAEGGQDDATEAKAGKATRATKGAKGEGDDGGAGTRATKARKATKATKAVKARGDQAAEGDRSAPSGSSPREADKAGKAGRFGKAEPAVFYNEALPFIEFVGAHPVGSQVEAVVEEFSSHGAYVRVDGAVRGYVPLRHLADPAPRSARAVLKVGETRDFVVVEVDAARRGIDLAVPGVVPGAGTEVDPAGSTEDGTDTGTGGDVEAPASSGDGSEPRSAKKAGGVLRRVLRRQLA